MYESPVPTSESVAVRPRIFFRRWNPLVTGRRLTSMATVLVDAENVRRSLWPNLGREELSERAAAWGSDHGHDVVVVWEGSESADDRIAREVTEIEPPIWVVTSDRELRRRVHPYAERILGGGSFARDLRPPESRHGG
jgi:hypothetical protein